MLRAIRAEKVLEKIGSFVLFLCFLPDLGYVNCTEKVCNFSADLSKKCFHQEIFSALTVCNIHF